MRNLTSCFCAVGIVTDEVGIDDGWMGLDIGPATRAAFTAVIDRAGTVLWNGPVGVFEMPAFAAGTLAMMDAAVRATARGSTVVIGGGDTAAASRSFFINGKPASDQVSWISTGGGSSLVLMENKMLPAVSALSNKGDYSLPPPPVDEGDDDEDD